MTKKSSDGGNSSNSQYRQDNTSPGHKTDDTARSEGEYVDYEEVD